MTQAWKTKHQNDGGYTRNLKNGYKYGEFTRNGYFINGSNHQGLGIEFFEEWRMEVSWDSVYVAL